MKNEMHITQNCVVQACQVKEKEQRINGEACGKLPQGFVVCVLTQARHSLYAQKGQGMRHFDWKRANA